MHFFIEKRTRGVISYIAKRKSKPNSKPNKPGKFIICLDASNLYNWSMSLDLSYGGYKLLNWGEIDQLDVNSIEENSPIGYIFRG